MIKIKRFQEDTPPMSTHFVSFTSEINPMTTETLSALCGELATKGAEKIYLFLSTPGGSVAHGITLYNTLRALPVELVTHNTGNVNSIGIVVFLAGSERYSSPHATFMFHGVGFDIKGQVRLEEKQLRERLDGILADQKKIGAIIAERTDMTGKEVSALFRQAKTRDPDFARAKGIIHDIREAEVPRGAPFHQLVFQR